MEAREQIESTDDPAQLQALRASTQAQAARVVRELSVAFKSRELQRAAALVAQLTYIVRLEEAITAKL
jgi:DnaJ-domain-containing protein 1